MVGGATCGRRFRGLVESVHVRGDTLEDYDGRDQEDVPVLVRALRHRNTRRSRKHYQNRPNFKGVGKF